MTDETATGTKAPSEFEALSQLIKEYHEAAQETDKKVIELIEKINNDLNIATEKACDTWINDIGAINRRMTEIKLSLGEIIYTKKEPIPSVFWLKVGLAIGIPTIINIASIIMNLSGFKLFYW